LDMDRCDPPTNGGGVYRDRSLGQSEAEDAVEGLEDLFEVVPSVGVVRRISRSSGRGEDGLAAPGLVLFGEGLVGLNGADGGDEVAPSPGCGDGGWGGIAEAVGAAPGGDVGEGGGLGECQGVAQVEQQRRSTSGGAATRQTMQTPSPSQGRSGMAAEEGRRV
jgi:hypothetical protein